MDIQEALILPEDVELIPAKELSDDIRAKVQCSVDSYVLSRPRSRTQSTIVDPEGAALLQEFRNPLTIYEAVTRYSKLKKKDPNKIMELAFPLLINFRNSNILVPSNSEQAKPIQPSFTEGTQFNGLELKKCIQLVEDSEIYQAKDKEGNLVALKIMRPCHNNALFQVYERETIILKHLDGTFTPKYITTGVTDNRSYIVMEFCSGEHVARVAKRFRDLPMKESRKKLLDLCQKIVSAYVHLHTNNVIHGDVHQGNLLFGEDGSLKVIDFGLGRLEGTDKDFYQPFCGGHFFYSSPEYTKHEQITPRERKATFASEQYSLAAMLYFLITGENYQKFSLDRNELFRQIREENILPFAEYGQEPWPEMEEILKKSLHKEPAGRFPSMAHLAKQLNTVKVGNESFTSIEKETMKKTEYVGFNLAHNFLDTILKRIDTPTENLFAVTTGMQLPLCSIHSGMTGIAYALYRIASIQGDASLLALSDRWLHKSIASMGISNAFYSNENHMVPEVLGRISPFHTPSGIYMVQALISHAMGDFVTQNSALDKFVMTSSAPCDNLDLTLGKSSTLLACSLLMDTTHDNESVNNSSLLALGDATMQSMWEKLNRFPTIQDCPEMKHLGIAHGWAGVIYATMRWCQSTGKPIPDFIPIRLRQLAELGEPVGRGLRWKSIWSHQEIPFNYMSGWCNGTAGMVHLWTLAHKMLKEQTYLDLAVKSAWNVLEDPAQIIGLCCGHAGQAYSLLTLYKHTGEEIWLQRAQELMLKGVHTATSAPQELPNSLFRGEIGLAVLIADLAKPKSACMPLFEAEGWRNQV
ncbi:lanthionine synthetase LanC family protein [Peribacillus sp. NJ11]|uniref:lanthionine synthetase LanC family protein n=1 Tax=Peribacillus sp. NJ11 TaxID=3055861 RepID=UPI0025A23388|nr:lanthionine synthetase LanC family protein [Peribacillus sp. NJ11]MDM5223542.1 lanthionine synthetase LanC family protein [Peribacillus sp. NJ11]